MITDNEKFIEIQGILSHSDISSNDCIKINNLIIELSKENQELKEKTKLFHKNGVFSLEYDKETLKDMVLEYQEKIDKAIEYINENWGHWCSNHCKYATETINILKGSDK